MLSEKDRNETAEERLVPLRRKKRVIGALNLLSSKPGQFTERDEAIRREPCAQYPWDGVAEVRPFGAMEKNIVEGVY